MASPLRIAAATFVDKRGQRIRFFQRLVLCTANRERQHRPDDAPEAAAEGAPEPVDDGGEWVKLPPAPTVELMSINQKRNAHARRNSHHSLSNDFARENRRAAMNWLGWLGWILVGVLGLIVIVGIIYYIRIIWEFIFRR